jgi:hypothetical protein
LDSGLRFKNFYLEVQRLQRAALAADAFIGTVKGDDNGFAADPSAQHVLVHLVLRAEAVYLWWITRVEAARGKGDLHLDLADLPKLYDDVPGDDSNSALNEALEELQPEQA